MSDKTIPDLRTLLAEATKPAALCTVPLKQGLRAQIAALEDELTAGASSVIDGRLTGGDPLKATAQRIAALRQEMQASALTFHFEAPDAEDTEKARMDMGGRDDEDEYDLRLTAATCAKVTGPDGQEFPTRMTWEDFKALRKSIGEPIYLATIKAKSDEVFRREWSVPFSLAASHILGTAK